MKQMQKVEHILCGYYSESQVAAVGFAS